MVIWFDWITVIISSIMLLFSFKRIILSTRYIVYFLFFIFYVFPLYLDCFYMPPIYKDWLGVGFSASACDFTTRIIYDLLIIFVQFFILNYKKYNAIIDDDLSIEQSNDISNGTRIALYIGMLIPVLLTALFSSHKFILYTLQWREVYDASVVARYTYFEKLSYIGVACSLVLLFLKKGKYGIIHNALCLLCLYSCICIEGKRSIIFFALLVVLLIKIPGLVDKNIGIERRRILLLKLVLLGIVAIVAMVLLTMMVKVGSRGYDASDIGELYTATRIDFLRDDRVRLAIYSLLNPADVKMIEYPLQTILNIPLFLFPFDYILNMKHITIPTYSMYLTSALLGYEHKAVMTPAFFAEIVSNFSFLGFIIMPYACVWFAKKSRKYAYPQNVFILTCFVLLQMYDFAYISYFIEFTIILCLMNRITIEGKHIYLYIGK